MARKDRDLAGFDEVANTNASASTNASINDSDNNNNDANDVISTSVIDSKSKDASNIISAIISEGKKKPVYCGFYLEPEIAKVLDTLAKKSGKKGSSSIKSKLANEALRKLFEENGLI